MSDMSHDTPPRDGTSGRYMPVHEAARLLQLSENAVRARLRRGTLTGTKRGASWYVLVHATDIPPVHTTAHQEPASDAPERTAVHVDLAPLADLIERQASELADARAAATLWQERARVLEGRLLQLGSGDVVQDTAPEAPESPPENEPGQSSIRAWWRRLTGS